MNESRDLPRTPPLVRGAPAGRSAVSPRLETASRALVERELEPEEFWATLGRTTPLVEPDPGDPTSRIVTFLVRDGTAAAVHIEVNKITQGPEDGEMERIPDTDIWWRTVRLDARWRGTYEITTCDRDQATNLESMDPRAAIRWMRLNGRHDPRNPRTEDANGGRLLSLAELDRAPAQPWIRDADRAQPTPHPVTGPRGRRLWVQTPADYLVDPLPGASPGPAPVLLVLDGQDWIGRGYVTGSAATLASAGLIRAPVIVHVDNGAPDARVTDLSADSDIDVELTHELLPWIRRLHEVSDSARDVVVCGQSLGGLTALRTALDHPAHVGAAIAQSSSLWQDDMLDRAARADPRRTRLWLEVGAHEPVLLEPHRRLREALGHRGVPLEGYVEYVGGHDPACWRGGIGEALHTLLPATD